MNSRIAGIHRQVELELRCRAKHLQSHTETVLFGGSKESRSVEVFSLDGHSTGATRAYAWEKLGDGINRPQEFTVVIKAPGINSAHDALKSIAGP